MILYNKYYNNKFLRIFCGFSVLLALNACNNVNKWVGHHSDDMLRIWGMPKSTQQLQNGDKLLQYSEMISETIKGESHQEEVCSDFSFKKFKCKKHKIATITAPDTYRYSECQTLVTVSPNSIIKDINRNGDGCSFPILNNYSLMPAPPENSSQTVIYSTGTSK